MVIVGVWLGVSRLASSEQDWRGLVADLQSPHEHLRWRGAFGLAQMLQADQDPQEGEPRLVNNPEVAKQLSDLLVSELQRGSQSDDDLKQQAFLARTLGLFHIPNAVLPALRDALDAEHDREIRKNALGAVAVIAGRETAAGHPHDQPELEAQLIDVSRDSDALIRQMAAFDLGLLSGDAAKQRLEVMLEDSDAATRANAAIGLARQDSLIGLPVLTQILQSANEKFEAGSSDEYQHFLALKNSIHAVELLGPQLDESQRVELIGLLQPIASDFREPRISVDARKVLTELDGS
jgi:HEAT repeat protein